MDDIQRQTLCALRDILFNAHLLVSSLKNQTSIWQERIQEIEALIDKLEDRYGADDEEAAGTVS